MTNQNALPSRPSYEFRRRVSLAIGALAVIAVLQGAFALWAVSLAEHHILRGRVAADIKQGFTELKFEKQQLRYWLAQRQFGANVQDADRDLLLEEMRAILSRLNALADRAEELDDGPASRARQADRQIDLQVLDTSIAQLARGLADLNPPPALADTTEAWRLANDLFDRAEGRDLRQLLEQSLEREDIALREKRADTDNSLGWLRHLWIGSTLVFVLAAVFLAAGFTQALRKPLRRLAEGAEALRAGDLSHRIDLDRPAEFAVVARSMNDMAKELSDHRSREMEARQALEEQVAARTGELRAALTLQQETEIRRRQLFAEISHELRTPTTAIRGEAQVTLRGGPKPVAEYEGSLRRIEDASRQLALSIDDLLTMARSDIDVLSLRHVPQDFHEVLNDVLSHGQAMARAGQISLDHDPWPENLRMNGDAARLRQLFLALLDNAIRYSRPGGSVHLSARRDPDGGPGLQVDISDQGIGISAGDLSRVFDRTFRGGNAARFKSDGSGLGLSIARALARGHGGDIELLSSPETGTTARVWLPLLGAQG